MPVAANQLAAQYLGADAAVYATTVPAAMTGNALQLLLAGSSRATNDPSAPVITAGGLANWVQVASVLFRSGTAVNYRVSLFRGMAGAPVPAAASITFGGGAEVQSACWYGWTEFTGVDTSGADGAGAIVQVPAPTLGAASAPSITLAALASVDNVVYGGLGHRDNQLYTPDVPNVELFDVPGSTPIGGAFGEWQAALVTDLTLNPTPALGTDTFWGMIAVEIAAAAAPAAGDMLSSRRQRRLRVVNPQEVG